MKYFIFDLDNTIYSPDTGLFKEIDERINLYLKKYVKIPENRVNEIRRHYWHKYGTTLNGLMRFHSVNPIHYLEFVHDVPIENYLSEDVELRKILENLDAKLIIFTNGYRPFAIRVLEIIGILDLFENIFDIQWMNFIPKPKIYGYLKLIKELRTNGNNCTIFDDFPLNLAPAKNILMRTVLVNEKKFNYPFIDYKISTIKKLKEIDLNVDN